MRSFLLGKTNLMSILNARRNLIASAFRILTMVSSALFRVHYLLSNYSRKSLQNFCSFYAASEVGYIIVKMVIELILCQPFRLAHLFRSVRVNCVRVK